MRRAAALLFPLAAALAAQSGMLPVYIEDSHAGSYYWIVEHIPRDRPHTLIQIDAHADSSEIFDSDRLRDAVLQAASDGNLPQLIAEWRKVGAIQCYDWIEPLLPAPIERVWWVPADSLTAHQRAEKTAFAHSHLNRFVDVWRRDAGDLSSRYSVASLDELDQIPFDRPLVVSIDLDYFATDSRPGRVTQLLDRVLRLPKLAAITIAISRPYLNSDAQADALLAETISSFTKIANVSLRFEPFAKTGPDRSAKAEELTRRHLPVPEYRIEAAPPPLRSLIVQNAARFAVDMDRERWDRLVRCWREESPRISLEINGQSAESGARIRQGIPFRISGRAKARWRARVASRREYNITGEAHGFADGAPRFVDYQDIPVAENAAALSEEQLLPFLDGGLGTLRVYAELPDGSVSNFLEFSRFTGDGYPGKLTEIFNLPYVYGSALLRIDGEQSADARYGADCGHFIVYGRRRMGYPLPYRNPAGLLPYLEEIEDFTGLQDGVAMGANGPIRITQEQIAEGFLLHFGRHIAAVFSGAGTLNASTPVVHQLEDYPQITTFGAMAGKYKRIRIMRFKP